MSGEMLELRESAGGNAAGSTQSGKASQQGGI